MYSGRLKKTRDEDLSFRITDRVLPDDIQAIDDGISAYNRQATGENRRPCHLTARWDDRMIGGLEAVSVESDFYIKKLWVDSSFRRKGVGRALMEKAAGEAGKRQCARVWVDTLDFQAPSFYERLGLREVGRVQGYRDGHDRIFFVKDIAQADGQDG